MRKDEIKLDYKDLFNKMLNGFAYHKILLDDDGEPTDYLFLEMNRSFEELTGLKRDKALGKKVTELISNVKQDKADWIKRYGRVALSGQDERFEDYSEALDKWYEVYAYSPHKGYFATIVSDISEKKSADIISRENERKYKRLLDETEDMITILELGLPLKYKYVNTAHKKCLGYEPSELIKKSPIELIHPDDRHKVTGLLGKIIIKKDNRILVNEEESGPVELTYRMKNKDGNFVVIESSAVLIDKDIFVISRDITSREEHLSELKKEKDRAEMYLDISGSIILELDNKFRVVTINKAGAKILGDDVKNIIGSNWLDYIPKRSQEEIKNIYQGLLKGFASAEYFENVVQPKGGGEPRLISWRNKALKDDKGKIKGTLSSGQDLTHIKAAELELRKKIEDFEKFNKIVVGRELKMIELKKKLQACQSQLVDTNIIHEEDKNKQ